MSEFIEIPATKRSLSRRKPVHRIGMNDANYMVCPIVNGKKVRCQFYTVWSNMIERCYDNKFQEKNQTYINCSVVEEWLTFSVFKSWMIKQDWQGKQLDKDILIPGNKEYGPDSCIFVSHAINSLAIGCATNRGLYPQGVSFNKQGRKYRAQCHANERNNHLGYFKSINEAEIAYLSFKADLIKEIASEPEALGSPKLQAALLIHAGLFKKKAGAIK
jgi:hypothetical protein